MDNQIVAGGIIGSMALMAGFWAAGKFLPGILVNQLHKLFVAAKDNPWMRDASKPYRARLLLAVAEFLEQEIPDAGTGEEVYAALGVKVSAVVHIGTASQWAKVIQQFGDAVDTDLDQEVLLLAVPPPPPSAAS